MRSRQSFMLVYTCSGQGRGDGSRGHGDCVVFLHRWLQFRGQQCRS